MAPTLSEMEDRRDLLMNHALIVKEEGPLGLQCSEELMYFIVHHFIIRKHKFYVYHGYPDPFIIVFLEKHDIDMVFC
jgi:hypothetical protein